MSAMTLPRPPLALARRTGGLAGRADPLAAYEEVGAESKAALLSLLPEGWLFAGKRVLDFGCGAGATLRHFLPEAEFAEFWGADIDTASIAWLQAHLSPPLRVMRNRPEPPLGLEHGTFDLIWALSVFTHLTDRSLDGWSTFTNSSSRADCWRPPTWGAGTARCSPASRGMRIAWG